MALDLTGGRDGGKREGARGLEPSRCTAHERNPAQDFGRTRTSGALSLCVTRFSRSPLSNSEAFADTKSGTVTFPLRISSRRLSSLPVPMFFHGNLPVMSSNEMMPRPHLGSW